MADNSLFSNEAFDTPPTAPSPAATHSLYRKYRPTSFASDELVGQEHVVHTLRNAIRLDRISHAYLFCGPRGTGKTTTARLLAKAVNCLDPDPDRHPCNTCDACRAINQGASIDVIEIDAASNRGIDDIRDLRERVKYAPTQLKTKFYIIDEAHQITGAAANAFLKTLEEPPPHTRFVLATTDPEELLPTIVSRCQRFDFRRIGLDAMVPALRRIADLEHIAIDDEALPVIARQATGSMRDALGMLDQVAMYREGEIQNNEPIAVSTVRMVLGISRNERVENLARALATFDPAGGLREINAAVEAGDDVRQLGRQLLSYLRLLMMQIAGGATDADATAQELARSFTLQELSALIVPMAELDAKMKRSSIPQLPLELAIVEGASRAQPGTREMPTRSSGNSLSEPVIRREAEHEPPRISLKDQVRGASTNRNRVATETTLASRRMARTDPDVSLESTKRVSPQDDSERTANPPKPAIESSPVTSIHATTPGPSGLSIEQLVDLWPQIRADVKALDRKIEAILQQIDPASVAGTQVLLVSPYDFHRNRVNTDNVRQVIEGVIAQLTGVQAHIRCVSREEADQIRLAAVPLRPEHVHDAIGSPNRQHEPSSEPLASNPTEPQVPSSPQFSEQDIEDRVNAARNILDAVSIKDDA